MGWFRNPFARSASAAPAPAPAVASAERSAPVMPRLKGVRVGRNYQAAGINRLTGSWNTQSFTADEIVDRQYRILVARSREQAETNDFAKKFMQLMRVNVIGSQGIMLQAKIRDPSGQIDTLASQSIEDAWAAWGSRGSCDVTGRLSWLMIQNLAIDSVCRDGEFIIVMHDGEGPGGLQLQMIDPLRLDVMLNRDMGTGNFIRFGIEFTPLGKAVAYHFLTTDANHDNTYGYGDRNYVRIPAERVIHEFLPERIGQKRGLPWMSVSLMRMKMLAGYEDASLVNARAGAAKMGVITKDENAEENDDDDELDIITDAEPGTIWRAPRGHHLEKFDLGYPQGEFADFRKACLRGISAGLGVAYNNLANDLEGVNFSSIRQGTLDERETYKALQTWMADVLSERVYDHWLMIQLVRGSLTVAGKPLKIERFEKYRAVTWQGRRWLWIDPEADMNAAVKGIDNRLASRGQIIREQGRDPEDVEAELREEEKANDTRALQRIAEIQAACDAANKKSPGLNLHWSQIVSINGSSTAPGAFMQAVGQAVAMADQNKTQAAKTDASPSK